jgi:hypothetical protein
MSLGLFEVGVNLWSANAHSAIQRAHNSNERIDKIEGMRAAIATRNLEAGLQIFREISKRDAGLSVSELGQFALYFNLCATEPSEVNNWSFSSEYTNQIAGIRNSNVCVIGPAPIHCNADISEKFDGKVVRKIGVGANVFGSEDGFGGQVNLAYTDRFLASYLNAGGDIEDIDRFDTISLNQEFHPLPIKGNFRIARTPNALFFSGAANKIPLMLYDLLIERPRTLKVIGVNFFASESVYSQSSREISFNGHRISQYGTVNLN